MAKVRNPYILIPIFFNVMLLAGIPSFGERGMELARLTPLLALALVLPWILYFVIGRIIQQIVNEQTRRREEAKHSDFV